MLRKLSWVQNRHLPQSGIPIDPDAGQDRCALCTTVNPRGRERETHPWRQNKKRKKIMLKLVPISSAGFQQNLSHVLSANSPLFCVWVCVGGCGGVCVCVSGCGKECFVQTSLSLSIIMRRRMEDHMIP